MDNVEEFAREVALFEQWARDSGDDGKCAAREALLRLTKLYLSALHLPPAWSDELSEKDDAERVSVLRSGEQFSRDVHDFRLMRIA